MNKTVLLAMVLMVACIAGVVKLSPIVVAGFVKSYQAEMVKP